MSEEITYTDEEKKAIINKAESLRTLCGFSCNQFCRFISIRPETYREYKTGQGTKNFTYYVIDTMTDKNLDYFIHRLKELKENSFRSEY